MVITCVNMHAFCELYDCEFCFFPTVGEKEKKKQIKLEGTRFKNGLDFLDAFFLQP